MIIGINGNAGFIISSYIWVARFYWIYRNDYFAIFDARPLFPFIQLTGLTEYHSLTIFVVANSISKTWFWLPSGNLVFISIDKSGFEISTNTSFQNLWFKRYTN